MRAMVAVPRPIRRLFTYTVPEALAARCRRGVRVVVPFGGRRLTGFLVQTSDAAGPDEPARELKPIAEVLDAEPVLDDALLELTRWAADYYVVSWGEMIRAALPGMKAVLRRRVTLTGEGLRAVKGGGGLLLDASLPSIAADPHAREVLGILAQSAAARGGSVRLEDLARRVGPRFRHETLKSLQAAGLTGLVDETAATGPARHFEETAVLAADGAAAHGRLGRRQAELLEALRASGGRLRVPDLLRRAAGASRAALLSLGERGLVVIERQPVDRRPASLELEAGAPGRHPPTPDQQRAIEAIDEALRSGRFTSFLLHGVTGSGKTEVYLRAIEAAVAAGRRALYLVPEIGLTPLLARRMRARFGEVLALLHSGLTEGERHDEWRRIRDGRVAVVLGARSAVFAPIPGLGIVVIDEEHDGSYKQDEYPRYNGRDLALMRAKMSGAVAILGSATPSIESYDRARRGGHVLLELPQRIGSAGMPRVERIDMRREFSEVGRDSILSRRLAQALEDRLSRGEQSLILLNRRGFSTFVLCRACGHQVECRRCSIAMTLHRRQQRLRCHYCDDSRPVPAACPACGDEQLHFGGTGTEKLEDTMRVRFPGARIERMDRDTVRGRGAVEGILTRVERGEIDILMGTQMIAKGHDFPNVTLVGVLAADALLGMPDFRAGERTFQLLSQVAGRSGRGDRGGEVIVQAYDADHHAVRAACDHDYPAFAAKELAFRRAMNYPPYSALALALLRSPSFDQARGDAGQVADVLRGLAGAGLQVLGPAPAPLQRLRGHYRVQVLVKAANRRDIQAALAGMLAEVERRGRRLHDLVIDVDPISTL